jgi:hypothetical protein
MKTALLKVSVIASTMVCVFDRANACSLRLSYEPFLPRSVFRFSQDLGPTPEVRVDEIRRGHDGTPDACDNWGVVVLEVPVLDAGYSFEIVESSDPTFRFPDGFVRSKQRRGSPAYFRFLWDDGATDEQEPIAVLVRVKTMSSEGVQSEPQLLKIEHAGVSATR